MNECVFPRTMEEVLALIYVQAQDLSTATPEEILVMYQTALARILRVDERDYPQV